MAFDEYTSVPPAALRVVAAAIVERGRLLVVSRRSAERVFYLPGGKPEPTETPQATLARELGGELGVKPLELRFFRMVEDAAAAARTPVLMAVYLATVEGAPRPAADLAAMGWTNGRDGFRPLLAPTVRNNVVPALTAAGLLG